MKIKSIYLASILLIILILAAAIIFYYSSSSYNNSNQTRSIPTSLNTSFQLKINQNAIIDSNNITITFLNITEDSRCPDGVVCVWPGQVKALFNLRINEKQETFNLTLYSNETYSQKTFEGYSVRLVEVSPYPKLNKEINIDSYAATLIINPVS